MKTRKEKNHKNTLLPAIISAIGAIIGSVIVGYFYLQASIQPKYLEINATKTAESRLFTPTPVPSPVLFFTPTYTTKVPEIILNVTQNANNSAATLKQTFTMTETPMLSNLQILITQNAKYRTSTALIGISPTPISTLSVQSSNTMVSEIVNKESLSIYDLNFFFYYAGYSWQLGINHI